MSERTEGPLTVATYTGMHCTREGGDWCGEIVNAKGEKAYHGACSFNAIPKKADAQLFAAAPELLDVLLELGDRVWEGDNSQGFKPKIGVDVAVLERLRAAIKKARGDR